METFELSPIENIFDALAVRKIRNECREYMTSNSSEITFFHQIMWYFRTYIKESKSKNLRCFLFKANDKNVGYALIKIISGKYYITGGLKKAERGKGYGKKLFKEIVNIVPSSEVYLDVLQSNTIAKMLYESLGFRKIKGGRKNIEKMRVIKK